MLVEGGKGSGLNVMKFKFDWTETVSGTIEINAPSGKQAERLFREMEREYLVANAQEVRSEGVQIEFIENRLTGIVTDREWSEHWQMSDEEWEWHTNACPDWA